MSACTVVLAHSEQPYASSPPSSFLHLTSVNSRIAQAYASEVFACYFHHKAEVRSAVMQVVSMVLKLGLVPPAQVCILNTNMYTNVHTIHFTVLLYNYVLLLYQCCNTQHRIYSNGV